LVKSFREFHGLKISREISCILLRVGKVIKV